MKSALRRNTDMLFRYGGEEFVVLLPGVLLDGAQVVAENIRLAVRNLAIRHDRVKSGIVTVSCGVASLEGDDVHFLANPAAELIRLADAALYQAKDAGRDAVKVERFSYCKLR